MPRLQIQLLLHSTKTCQLSLTLPPASVQQKQEGSLLSRSSNFRNKLRSGQFQERHIAEAYETCSAVQQH